MKKDQKRLGDVLLEPELIPIPDEPIQGIDDKKAITKAPKDLKLSLHKSAMTQEQILAIRSSTPKQFTRTFQGRGGKELTYVPIALYIRKLNFVFGYGNWSFEIVKSDIVEDNAVVQGKLVIPDLNISVGQFGGHPIARTREGKAVDPGDSLKAAASDCFKKCTSMIGMFSDVYSPGEFAEIEQAKEPKEAMKGIFGMIKKSSAKQAKEMAAKFSKSDKYTPEEKKQIMKALDERMRELPDGEPLV